jgi:ribosomal subunit interface protein
MKVIIQSPDIKAQESLLRFVNKKMEKLGRLSDRLQDARVVLKTDKSDSRENKVCEIRLVIPGNDLFTVKQAATFEEAVTKAYEAIKNQLAEWKSKHIHL